MQPLVEIRLRSKISDEELEDKVGKILTEKDYNVLLTGASKVVKPDGKLLCIYLPQSIPQKLNDLAYPVLHEIQGTTDNRGLASGSKRVQRDGSRYSRANSIKSSLIGYFERQGGRFPFCRTTAWTGSNAEKFREIFPLFKHLESEFKQYVPDRYARQKRRAEATEPEWVIGDMPWTTVTVNNTYPTGVHKDQGDLDEGFSNLAVLRRGDYVGGHLAFPRYRTAVNMQDGDLILMDAHEWHGNTQMRLDSEDAERISLVLYYRTNMITCGTAEEEIEHAKRTASKALGIEPTAADTVTTQFTK
tara:strand:- start:345 stop:1253 length:909 start_codon:yes stop_codon:yes gene_type:complete